MKTKNDTLEYYLLEYLKANHGWHDKVLLYYVGHKEEYSPESVGRILRILSENGTIICEYYKGKKRGTKLARYCYGEKPKVKKPTVVVLDGVALATYD